MAQQTNITLGSKQLKFLAAQQFQTVFGGGSDAGKSLSLVLKIYGRAKIKGAFEGFTRRSAAQFAASFLRDWGDLIPHDLYEHAVRDQMIHIIDGGTIHYFGCDDEQKLGSKNLTGCAFDELAEHPTPFAWNKISTLVRRKVPGLPNQLYGCTNPSEKQDHWLIDRFQLDKYPLQDIETPDSLYIHTDCRDVGKDNDYILQRFPMSMGRYYRDRFLWGQWGLGAQGLVFDGFGDQHITKDDFAGRRVIVGVDDGSTDDNPFAVVRLEQDGDRIVVTDERYKKGLTNPMRKIELVREVAEGAELVVVDYSAGALISLMRDDGLPAVRCRKGDKSITSGIDQIRRSMGVAKDGKPNFLVAAKCRNTIREFRTYCYAAKTGVPKDEDNHCIAEGELVTCERGKVPIEEVTTADRVLTRGGWRAVTFSGQTDAVRDTVTVKTTGGSVRCTPDHRIWTTNRGFVRADWLTMDDAILYSDGASFGGCPILFVGFVESILPAGRSFKVYDLTVDTDHEFVCGGVLVSNCADAVRYSYARLVGANTFVGGWDIPERGPQLTDKPEQVPERTFHEIVTDDRIWRGSSVASATYCWLKG